MIRLFDKHNSRRCLMALCLLICTAVCAVAQQAVRDFVRESGIPSGSLAVLVVDVATGDTIAAHNVSAPLIPASIMKSVTTAALLQHTGPDYEYHTRVYTEGDIDSNGILHGNVVTVASGDPSLNSRVEPVGTDIIAEIAEALMEAGVKSIEGRLIVDDSVWSGPSIPSGWARPDLARDYGTGIHSLNFENNTKGSSSVSDPTAVYLGRLRGALEVRGINVQGKTVDGGTRNEILDHVSPPIDEIMRSLMMRSDNMMAEAMLRTYSKETGGDGSTTDGASRGMSLWKRRGLPMEGVRIEDGSGLSRSNRLTADFMGSVLRDMSHDVYYASFFPLAGQEGTLRKFLCNTELDSYIAMKTGSMTGIQCFAGYKLDEEYAPTHIVVIMANDIQGGNGRMKKAAAKMLLRLFGCNVPSEQ
ncbi:MAG: D-alanyl-D-alanine carboxypeptidase [Muribaculaceae bacterium]|nr:D-alanyl-D-alanine carboxypeptidase [Muribaculaceae bacterium]MDE7188680.1 D-alanyl-D-alanine carboxypeptidase [Muribaculaceae bacterium]